jgi:capsular exopolysaccharide synthesis family protein
VSTHTATALDPYRRAVRRHPWLVALVTLVTLAAAIAWTSTRTREYTATAQILVTPQSDDPSTAGLPLLHESVDPTQTLSTASTMLSSSAAVAATAQELKLSPQVVRDALDVQPQGNAAIASVSAKSDDPQAAARIANTYAEQALRVRRGTLDAQIKTKLDAVQARLKAAAPDSATAVALAGQAGTLQALADGQDPNFSLLQDAPVPTSASGKSTAFIVVLSLLVGLALGVAAALAVEQIDRRVRDEDELIDLSSLPVLARVPVDRHHADPASPTFGAPEALRALQIQLEARGKGTRTVVITSASEGDGKTTTAIALARTLVAAGKRVVLLDFDLRKGEVGERLGVRSDLLRMLRHDGSLEDVLQRVEGVRNLLVLSPAPVGDAGALFQTYWRRLPELIEQSRAYGDFVIIDTPPLGRVADALRLAAHADELLLVARPGHTDRRELKLAQETLAQLAITPSGLVVTGGARRTPGYYGFTGGDALTMLGREAEFGVDGGDANRPARRSAVAG